MKVHFISRKKAEKMISNNSFSKNAAVISFYDPDDGKVDYSSVTDRVFYVGLPDISFYDLSDCGYTLETFFTEADDVAEFIIKAHNDGYDICCQCEHGESRSTAAAAAIREFYYHDGIKLFADYCLCPNRLIFNKIYDALKRAGIITKNEILSLVYPPVPTELCSIPTVAGQIALQIAI